MASPADPLQEWAWPWWAAAFFFARAPATARSTTHWGDIKPSKIISHRLKLEDAPSGYDIFNKKEDACTKIVMKP